MIDNPIPKSIHGKIRFLVTCDLEKGEVQVEGPIAQKLLAIKILADAIHIVTDYNVPPPKSNILTPDGGNGRPQLLPS